MACKCLCILGERADSMPETSPIHYFLHPPSPGKHYWEGWWTSLPSPSHCAHTSMDGVTGSRFRCFPLLSLGQEGKWTKELGLSFSSCSCEILLRLFSCIWAYAVHCRRFSSPSLQADAWRGFASSHLDSWGKTMSRTALFHTSEITWDNWCMFSSDAG